MNEVLTVPEAIRQCASVNGSRVRVRGVLVISSTQCHLSPSRALRDDVSGSIAIDPKFRSVLDDKTGGTWFLLGGDAYYFCDAEISGTLITTTSLPYPAEFSHMFVIVLMDQVRGRRLEVALD